MAKTVNRIGFTIFSILSIIFCLALVSANTVVGGKIYNSDFSGIIEGAEVTVECGSDIKTTESIDDGTYAIAFDSETCYIDIEVDVSAVKGDLSDDGSGFVYESEEKEGEFVAIINLNLKSADSGSRSRDRGSGTWFMCGNTVCDSGETYSTCPLDCPQTIEETTTQNTNSNPEENNTETPLTITTTSEETNPGITGAVVGTNNSGNKGSFLFSLVGIILLLLIGVIGISVAKNEKGKYHPPKMEESRTMYKPLSGFY